MKNVISRGKLILNALVENLLTNGLDKAAEVILTGCSGMGMTRTSIANLCLYILTALLCDDKSIWIVFLWSHDSWWSGHLSSC